MVWLLLLLERAFVCLLITLEETVQFMQFVPECCLAIEYIQYKVVSFPQENVQFVQFVDVSSVPECCLQGITWNQKCCMQLITSHDKKDCDGITNGATGKLEGETWFGSGL